MWFPEMFFSCENCQHKLARRHALGRSTIADHEIPVLYISFGHRLEPFAKISINFVHPLPQFLRRNPFAKFTETILLS